MTILNITLETLSVTNRDRNRDPHQSIELSSKGPVEEWKEGEYEQGCQDHEDLVNPLRHCVGDNGNSPTPAGLGMNEHGIKLVPLNVVDSWED